MTIKTSEDGNWCCKTIRPTIVEIETKADESPSTGGEVNFAAFKAYAYPVVFHAVNMITLFEKVIIACDYEKQAGTFYIVRVHAVLSYHGDKAFPVYGACKWHFY